jgi:cell division septum initiation protein DivIVA
MMYHQGDILEDLFTQQRMGKMMKAAKKADKGMRKAAKTASKAMVKSAKMTGKAMKKTAKATGKALKRTASKAEWKMMEAKLKRKAKRLMPKR